MINDHDPTRCTTTYNSKYYSGITINEAKNNILNKNDPNHYVTYGMQVPEDLTTSLSFIEDIFKKFIR